MSCHPEMSGGSSFVVSSALRIVMLFSGASAKRTSVGPPAWGALPAAVRNSPGARAQALNCHPDVAILFIYLLFY